MDVGVNGIARGVEWRVRTALLALPPPVKARLRRLAPIGAGSGARRGTPVDGSSVDRFVEQHAGVVRGRVLEAETPELARRYGHDVERIDVLDVDAYNDEATVLADLEDPGSLPEAAFDCVLLDNVLERATNAEVAVSNAWRSVAEGGALLLSVPQTAGLREIIETSCPGGDVEIEELGSSLAAALPMVACACVVKRGSG
jgi:SAM-dependent methyltransferase